MTSFAAPGSNHAGAAAARHSLGPRLAAALVIFSSASVLVVELVALRLLAPYLGLTLETNTLVIGIALTAIAVGAWVGGRLADQGNPRRLLGPALGVSGAVVAVTPAAVRAAAELAPAGFLPVAMACILVPGALLSAVTPIVTTLRLTDLGETGTIVGRLSGLGTAGAIAGTVLTGFVLISRVPVSTIMVALGLALLLVAVMVDWRVGGWSRRSRLLVAGAVAVGGLGAAVAPGGCDVETTYHCAVVVPDPGNPDGRTLVLDGVRHSYVDLADPTELEFDYVQALASVSDVAFPAGDPLSAHHLGAGGVTFPRYLEEQRPGTESTVSEIDGAVVELGVDELGVQTDEDLEIRVEDARLGLAELPAGSQDLVVGDAFGGISVPFHLATTEMMAQIQRTLAADGIYAANLIDHPPLAFARAETATIASVFDHVVLLAPPGVIDGAEGGNLVAVGSDLPIPTERIEARLAERGSDWRALEGEGLTEWVGDAPVLTDDYAPVDQLLTP
ncbi:MAG TPA: fused MFS/spermidine synthase [Ornithinimicrobium sp.]|uniref:fused MFS/spermidine synthase n=1 Tax=Ornithinimicrobium sp. TaxID=1977084 RepID=UPI002B48D84C|nr:fused MFS/spermidine synthase [Ornithinimicrobium sp.]HKJ11928.1 fused MFS/spermidine synthase [Ornithinimicrobium sp.]